MSNEDNTQMTEVKTMWSETLLESLYVALEKNKGDKMVREILRDLFEKGYKKDYLVEKVNKKVGPNAASRLKRMFGGGASQQAATTAAARPAAASRKKPGMVDKLKGLFK